jgi:hypothetical protein
MIGWLASPAYAQLPELPELPEVPVLDPPDLPLPDLPDVPDPADVPVPDPGDIPPLPDPGDLPLPDPGELPLPDPGELPKPDPDPGTNPGDNPRADKDPSGRADGKGSGFGQRGRGAGGSSVHAFDALAAARGGSAASSDPVDPVAKDEQGAVDSLAPFAFPIALILAVAAFVAFQGYYDRKDPKLALGPVDPSDQLLTFN